MRAAHQQETIKERKPVKKKINGISCRAWKNKKRNKQDARAGDNRQFGPIVITDERIFEALSDLPIDRPLPSELQKPPVKKKKN